MATNLDIQMQLNQLLAEQNKFLEASGKLLKDQVSLGQSLVSTLKAASFKDVAAGVEDVNRAVQQAGESTKGMGDASQGAFQRVTKAVQEASAAQEKAGDNTLVLSKKFAFATAALDGMRQGARFTAFGLKSLISIGAGLISSLGHLAISIISIPFKMLTGLLTMADAGGQDTALAQALENIRKEFGSLRETSGKAIVDMAKSMKGDLGGTGLQVTRIFGNLAERLATLQEYAHNLGPLFSALAGQFVRNAEVIGAYYKGLGLTEEAQKAVAMRSFALGTAVTEELRSITNYSQQLSKGFNGAAGSAKEISRDMGTLMADFKNFGGMATKEIGQAVVYFRRLGLEVSKVMGVISKYDNFTDAAEGAAQLSQAFGLNVDALKMMKAQNPAERVEMLRKSFFQAGKTIENMTRQERALLSQQTGLDESALDLAFSMKNQGMSYDQVTRKGDAAKKSQLTQAQSMKALADSIERLVRSGSHGSGGFLDRFIQGFQVGIQRSSEFRKIMRELRQDLRIAYFEGIKVGRAFVDMFPGVKDVFNGISDLFNPARFRKMFAKVGDAFREFFGDMTKNPRTALPKLLEKLKTDFFEWFSAGSSGGQKILNGFKSFFIAISHIAGGMLKYALDGIRTGVIFITDLLTGKKSLGGLATGTGFIGQLLAPIIANLQEALPPLWQALKTLFSTLWEKIKPHLADVILKSFGVLGAPALIGLISRTVAVGLAQSLAGGVAQWAAKGGATKMVDSMKTAFGTASNAASNASNALSSAQRPGAASAASGIGGVIKGAEGAAQAVTTSKVNWLAATAKMLLATTFIVVGMAGVLVAIFKFSKAIQENRITPQSVAVAAGAMLAATTVILGVAVSIKLLSSIDLNPGMLPKILAGLAMIAVVSAGMAYGAMGLINMFGNVPMAKVSKTVLVMGAIGTFFLAAAAVTAIAGVVGAIAVAGAGIGALMIGAGLALIAMTIGLMAVEGLKIMNIINKFNPGPGFIEKARVFVDIMKAIGSFAGTISSTIAATQPSFFSFLRGNPEEEQRKTLTAVAGVITVVGVQIRMLIDSIRTTLQSLSGSEQELRAAQVIGNVLSGVSGFAQAIQPPSGALTDPGFFASMGGDTISRRISLLTEHTVGVTSSLTRFLTTITGIIRTTITAGITPDQERLIKLLPSLLDGVGLIAQAMRPSPNLLHEINQSADFGGAVQQIGLFMRSTMNTILGSGLFERIGTLINGVVASLQTLDTGSLKTLQALAPIIAPVFNTVASLAGVLGSLSGGGAGDGNRRPPTAASAGAIFNMTQLVSTFFDRIKTDLPLLVTNMRLAFTGLNVREIASFTAGIDGIKKIFEVVGTIPALMTTLSTGAPGSAAVANANPMRTMIGNLYLLKRAFLEGGADGNFLTVIRDLIPKLTEMGNFMGNPGQFAAKMSALKAGLDVVANIPTAVESISRMGNLPTLVTAATERLRTTNFTQLSTVVRDMVTQTNELGRALHGIRPITVERDLQNLGRAIGMGSQGTYTIENRNFTINVNVVVKLDNNGLDALELSMLRRVGTTPTRLVQNNTT